MSKQAVLSFILQVNQDKTLMEKINSLPSSRVESLIDIAHDAGFDFTTDEFVNTVLEESRKAGEIAEEDLEQVAGGAFDAFHKFQTAPTSLNFADKFIKFDGSLKFNG